MAFILHFIALNYHALIIKLLHSHVKFNENYVSCYSADWTILCLNISGSRPPPGAGKDETFAFKESVKKVLTPEECHILDT